MPTYDYDTIVNPSTQVLQPIEKGLHNYNLSHLGERIIHNYAKVAVVARDEAGTVVGGIHGDLLWEWLHVETLWVSDEHRGQNIGTTLLRALEEAAVARGFTRSHLETTGFQALQFYLKNGYEIFGELEGKPAGHIWYYLKKDLLAAGQGNAL